MIDYATIERIQSAAQITDVVSDFITLRKKGVNYVGLCPFHDDKSPSFTVSPAKNICKCFACGEGGTPLHFVMKHEQLTYVEALKYLAKKYGIEVKETELTDEQKQVGNDRESMFILNAYAQKSFTANLFENLEGKSVGLSYFRERGFRDDIIKKFQLGYSLEGRDAFSQQAMKAGYEKTYLEKTGLAIVGENNYVADRFRGRVMFPVHTLSGKIVAFGGRILKDEKTAKYVNSPESEIYHKGNELYGIYFARQAIVKQDRCFLVEGYTDVISMHQAGIENVVASSGTALTQGQIRLIHRFTTNVTVLYDGDTAGIKAAIRGIDLLLEAGLNIKIVLLPEGEDPDSFARKQNATSFNEYIRNNETDFVRFKAGLLMQEAGNDPVKKAQMLTEIITTIALIPEEIIRLLYIKECSRITGVDEGTLVRAISKKRQENLLQKKKPLYPEIENPEGSGRPPEEQVFPPENQDTFQDFDLEKVSALAKHERAILHYVVRYGEVDMLNVKKEANAEDDNHKEEKVAPLFVIEYIWEELVRDDLKFSNSLYQLILEEAYQKYKEEGFKAEIWFKNHANPQISKIAVDLATDKYIESKIHSRYKPVPKEEEKLIDQVPYELVNYKNVLLQNHIDEINLQIKNAENNNDFEQMNLLLKELSIWSEKKKEMASLLRERIVQNIKRIDNDRFTG
ncbi:MAG: DNA primase [Dysgonamonadaceae bacterium]|jgi:DNA primase|nr:DNA primase [Dysgonamonadaceae bacterium]